MRLTSQPPHSFIGVQSALRIGKETIQGENGRLMAGSGLCLREFGYIVLEPR